MIDHQSPDERLSALYDKRDWQDTALKVLIAVMEAIGVGFALGVIGLALFLIEGAHR